jgi:hypothetical protein
MPDNIGAYGVCIYLTSALNCSVWIDFHIYMSGLGLIYLVLLRWSRCRPWSSDWKRVMIIIIIIIIVNLWKDRVKAGQ